jgi:hypothetical protein
MVTLLLVGFWPAGCASTAPGVAADSPPAVADASTRTPATEPAPNVPSEEAPMSRLRTIGLDDEGHEVVLRFGDRLDVVLPGRSGDWVVVDFPAGILRPDETPRAPSSYGFVAIAVGEGQLSLAPASPKVHAARMFTVRIKVLRDTVQPEQQ